MGRGFDHADLIYPQPRHRDDRSRAWTWKSAPVLTPASFRHEAGTELTCYRAYQARLAGHPIGGNLRASRGVPQAGRRDGILNIAGSRWTHPGVSRYSRPRTAPTGTR
jgi:hypothetical protein